jgi:hypothetical protein
VNQHEPEYAQQGDERERALDAREDALDAREARRADRRDEVDNVLAKGTQRDQVADARDWDAARRDMAANMQAWMTGDERREDIDARQDALDDRLHSKGDRASSAIDRSVLADIDNSDDPR